jgi:hypothetical protein
MFKLAGAFLCLCSMIGCASGQIEVVKDDFRNTSLVKMELDHRAGIRVKGNAIYTREFSAGKGGPVIVNYAFTASANAANLEQKCMIKAGEKVFEASFADISGEVHTEISQQKTTTYTADDTGFVDFTKGSTAVTGISAHSNKVFRSKLQFPDAAEKEILASNKLSLRIYFGTETSTFEIDGSDLQSIKDFIQSTPDKIVKTAAAPSKSDKPNY